MDFMEFLCEIRSKCLAQSLAGAKSILAQFSSYYRASFNPQTTGLATAYLLVLPQSRADVLTFFAALKDDPKAPQLRVAT